MRNLEVEAVSDAAVLKRTPGAKPNEALISKDGSATIMTLREYIRQFNYTLDRNLTRGVKWIILANVAVFLVDQLFFASFGNDDVFLWLFAQNPIVFLRELQYGGIELKINWLCPIQFLSYMFVHATFWHLFWNMLALWFFGPPLEALWGKVAFLKFYLFTGFMAGALHGMIAPFFIGEHYYMIGASGAVFGVLLAFAVYYPQQKVLLWFVLPMSSRYFVMLIGFVTFLSLLGGGGSHVSHLTHLAGLGFGYAWLRLREHFPTVWLFNEAGRPFTRIVRRSRFD
jgi:membrane associated rhomboid family serine protease